MGIEQPTLAAAVRDFRDHLNGLLARTVTQKPLVSVRAPVDPSRGGARFLLSFRDHGKPVRAPLDTRYGRAWLSIRQYCESEPVGRRRHRLMTAEYWYAVGFEEGAEPLLRWEYVRAWPGPRDRWCRHHLQGTPTLQMGKRRVSLSDLHLPTGYVTIEEILRFCIVDLDVPRLSGDWHDELERSYRRFKKEFAS